ncbi:NUDIX hydrolase [Streptomyces sp. NPDC013953]|uniref:NUDIX hydrolase n=1 Tax=Streptomyces sp. NPDC013953 TaxID=3364868 RepID=UPI0036FBCEA4
MTPRGPVIRAAGCVLWRRSPAGGGLEVAVIHRRKHGDWSLPKGKLEPGEKAREAAVREVLEETGMTCALGPELPTARYEVDGRPKEVRYWSAEATGGAFTRNREVDELLWLPPAAARARLTYEKDKSLLGRFLATHPLA